jgi:hypothetical protein
VRELAQRARVRVVEKQIGRALVAVGNKRHVIADPHRIAVGGIHMRDFLQLLAA